MSVTQAKATPATEPEAATPRKRVPRPRPPRSHRPLVVPLLGVLLVIAGAALGGLWQVSTSKLVTVVAAAHDIRAGATITRDDLKAAQVAGSGIAAIPGSDARSLLGQTAVGPIPEGALLTRPMLTNQPVPAKGAVAVGVSLKAGQLPSAEISAGRQVSVLLAPAAAQGAAAPAKELSSTVLVPRADVVSVTADPSGNWLVTVSVAAADAPAVSGAATAGRVALVLLPAGS